ncbi:hypothetical protein AAEX28_11100 [Lentisphaerota bacterium WC36G]
MDLGVGEIISAVDSNGLRENTVIICTSDNVGFQKKYSLLIC